MTNQEAINHVICGQILNDTKADKELRGLIRKALEKQIPQKPMEQISVMPIYSDNGCSSDVVVLYKAMCPNCNEELVCGELERSDCADIKFCSHCSQAIDWSEE